MAKRPNEFCHQATIFVGLTKAEMTLADKFTLVELVLIGIGGFYGLWRYRGDLRDRNLQNLLRIEESLSETRFRLIGGEGDMRANLALHLNRVELVATALNRGYLSGIAESEATELLKDDIAGTLHVTRRDGDDLLTKMISSDNTYRAIEVFYDRYRREINERADFLGG